MYSPPGTQTQERDKSPPRQDIPPSKIVKDAAKRTENSIVRPRKRQKVDLACEECRSRKVRCDGLRPECNVCKRRQKLCIYLPEASRLTGSRRVLHSLHDRLASLEAKANGETKPEPSTENITVSTGFVESLPLVQSPPAFNVGPSPSPSQRCTTDSILVPERILPHPSTGLSTTYASEDTSPNIGSLPSGQDLGDISAMGMALPTTEASTHISREFYGKPSAASLLHDMLHPDRRPSAPGDSKQDSSLHPSPPSTRRSFSVPCSSNTDEYHLPPRHVADNLLCIYRERVQIIYPFLHWQTLMEAYNRLWLSDSEIKNMPHLTGIGLGGSQCPVPVFYCALNAVFALATQFTDGSAHDRKERTAPFLRRSRHLMHLDFLDNANISLIQALLIFARYLQSTNLPSRCWNVAGMAYRMAQSLGLHLAMNETGTSELEREVRRRVWHSCVSLDTVLGMLTGRPISYSMASTAPLPSISDEKFCTQNLASCDGNKNDFPAATFFAESIKLSHILRQILGHIYDPWKKPEVEKGTGFDERKRYRKYVSSTMAFDDELDRFEAELPEVLRLSSDTTKTHIGSILAQQRHVLRSRFLHIRLLLYRSFLVEFCQRADPRTKVSWVGEPRTFSSQPYNAFIEKCCTVCIETAQTLIDHFSQTTTTHPGSPWYSCYYVYHAAIIVVAADNHSSQLSHLNHKNLQESWRACESFFCRISRHNPDMYRYFHLLERLSGFKEPPHITNSLTPSSSASSSDSSIPKTSDRTGNLGRLESQTIEEMIEHHITDSYPEPDMSLGSGNDWCAPSNQSSNAGLETLLCDDQLWTLTEFCIMDAGSISI
ncbi:transcription activator protein acu-15 [Fusarium fujikuroi]|nr:transcription activator protein acu-15 [Fusarium fujikuroi]